MGYLDENGLARYDGLLKNWVTFKSGTVDGIDALLNWQKTAVASIVSFYPLPAAPLDPVVNFLFTETGPAEGEKSPTNPSTITGISSITITRCETVGVDSTDYTVNLGNTYYGGSIDFSTGLMTVTWVGFTITGSEQGITLSGAPQGKQRIQYAFTNNELPLPVDGESNSICSHSSSFSSSQENTWGHYYVRVIDGTGFFAMQDKNAVIGSSVEAYRNWFASQYSNRTPVTVAYKLATPYTVQLTPLQIYSLSQINPYTPRLNTVYSDQQSVQVGYPKSPLATSTELTNTIVSLGGNI